jgi:hypothetical protein
LPSQENRLHCGDPKQGSSTREALASRVQLSVRACVDGACRKVVQCSRALEDGETEANDTDPDQNDVNNLADTKEVRTLQRA